MNIDIVVIRFPRIANFDDFAPFSQEPRVQVRYVQNSSELGSPHAIILPGTKSTIADLRWMQDRGLAQHVSKLAQHGTPVVGICGGYQMLGTMIQDRHQVESSETMCSGLGLLPIETSFATQKATHRVQATINYNHGWFSSLLGQTINGYEIHVGKTVSRTCWLMITRRGKREVNICDGAVSADTRIWGTYLHGLFHNSAFRRAWLLSLGYKPHETITARSTLSNAIDRLADVIEHTLDWNKLPIKT